MNKKYIIYDGEFRAGLCELHRDLVGMSGDASKVKGGGWYHFDKEKGIMYLYAKSEDFGQAKLEDVREAIEHGSLRRHRKVLQFAYSTEEWLGEAIENHILLERQS